MADTLIEFPCQFPIKIVGLNIPFFQETICRLIKAHCPDFADNQIASRLSSGDRYVSLTATVQATSKAQLDSIYQELSACEHTMMVL